MLCECCGFSAAIETVPDRRHRVPSTYRLCRDCAAEARGVLMPPRTDNHDVRISMLRALADHKGPMTREQLLIAIQAEEDEKRMLHGVISGLIRSPFVTAAGANLHITAQGRRQVEPVPGPPSEKPEIPVPPLPVVDLADLRAAIERVGIQGRDLSRIPDLCLAFREAIEVLEQRSESLITALRAIEAALPGAPSGLRADAIADRAVSELRAIHNLRRIERLYHDDRAAKERAEAERDKAVADLDKVNAETLDAYEKLEDEHRAEKAAHAETRASLAEADAEITRLRADLEGALAAEKATAEKLAEAESEVICLRVGGPYWTRQGDRHALSILRPVEIAVLSVDHAGVDWESGLHTGRAYGSGPEAIDLAQRLAEVAAGVRS